MAYVRALAQVVSLRLSPRWTEFDSTLYHVGLMIDKVALGQVFFLSTSVSLANSHFTNCSVLIYHPRLVQQASWWPRYQVDSVSPNPAKLYQYLHRHWQKSRVCATVFRRRFCQIASAFQFFGFHDNNLFPEHVLQPCVQPPTWMTRSLYLRTPVTGLSSYTFRQRIPLRRLLLLAGLRWKCMVIHNSLQGFRQ
jgi:hypothetical protein